MLATPRYLLDTSVLLWLGAKSPRLSATARASLEEKTASYFVSLVSVWEMQIKHAKGKLPLSESAKLVALRFAEVVGAELLPIKLEHIDALYRLPDIHRDPFDRIIVAQALFEGLTILSPDATLAKYPVTVLW